MIGGDRIDLSDDDEAALEAASAELRAEAASKVNSPAKP